MPMRAVPMLLIAALVAAGCSREDGARPADAPPPASQAPTTDATGAGTIAPDAHTRVDTAPPTPPPAPPPTAGASLALVAAVDEHEIAAVEQARGRKLSAPAREYAELLHREHSENLAAARSLASAGHLIEPEMTADVHALIGRGKAALETLAARPAADYERAWLRAMVDAHAESLEILDSRLIPAARDEPVRNFLNNTRDHMAMHLERGQALLDAGKR